MTRPRIRDAWGPARPLCAAHGCGWRVTRPELLLCPAHFHAMPPRLRRRIVAVPDWRRAFGPGPKQVIAAVRAEQLAQRRARARGQARPI